MVNSRILLGNFCLTARCFLHNVTDDIYLERNSSAAAQHSFPAFFFFRSMQFAKGAVLLEVEASDQHHLIFIFHSHLRPLSGDHLPCNEKIPILDPIESQYKCNSCNKGRWWNNIDRSQCFIRSICSSRDKTMTKKGRPMRNFQSV